MFGDKGKNVVGRRYAEVLPELKDQGIFEQLDGVYTTGIPFHAHNQRVDLLIHEKLTPHYFNYSFTPLFDITGNIYGVMNTAAEVTDLVTTKQKIEESEKKFRLLADSMPQHIWTSDIRGNLNYFNQSVFTYSGLSPEQIDKDGWLQFVHPDDREENIQTWMHSVVTGESFLFEHRFRRHDGEYRWQLSRALPVKDSHGKIKMWVGTSTDIDEIKKHQQEKDDFIKIASHELKTPVTTIKAYVQLLLNQDSTKQDEMLTKSLSTIEKQITKLAKLIADLMDVTKIELGSFQANKENFSMTELIRDIAGSIQATTTTHHIHFNYSADILVNADKDRITQVLTNLLTNAIKYSPNADKVVVDITTNAKELIVSIQDFGIGMANKDHEKIFDRFYRVENPEGKIFPGFGIGLFIVREIISNHKGKVWVKSEPGKGSTFYFSLPL
jgi:PAS domain S-box-containing protein